ncbi:MAG: nicotinamide riboside transporter PnuC [Clostridiales bacterium]|jgi:nicotinamide mononucleotide transporter|nr:nicotinamide riboside transporter PnuC [Clostridiales bacterium]
MKNFKSWSRLDILWTVFSLAAITYVCILTWDSSDHRYSTLSLFGTVFGMLNVILVAKCEVWVNITTAVLVEVAMGICYLHWNMLGNAVLNLFIFLPSNAAFIHWAKKQRNNTVPVRKLSAKWRAILASVTVVIAIVGGVWLSGINAQTPIVGEFMNAQFYGGSNPAPYLDAFSFIANIMALVLMYCLFIEQWYLWALVDAIALAMWIVTAANDPSMIAYNYAAMYLLWLLNAIYGVHCWRKSMKTKD